MNKTAEKIMGERFGKDSLIALATAQNGAPRARIMDAVYIAGRKPEAVSLCINAEPGRVLSFPVFVLTDMV